jgi:hypothetical protein
VVEARNAALPVESAWRRAIEIWRPLAAPPPTERPCPFDATAIDAVSGTAPAAGADTVTAAAFRLDASVALRTRSLAGGKALFPVDSACRRARDADRPSMAALEEADIGVR